MSLKQAFAAGLVAIALCLGFLNGAGAEGIVLSGSVEKTVADEAIQEKGQAPGIVGLDMVIRPGSYAVVRDVFRYSPAHQAGVRPGDKILAVNGETTRGLNSAQLDAAISDVPGTTVVLTVNRMHHVKSIQLQVASLAEVHPSLRALFLSSSY